MTTGAKQSLSSTEAISVFIKGAVAQQKQGRYFSFVNSVKGRAKFLKELDHSLEKVIVKSKIKLALTESEWNESGYLFLGDGTFGKNIGSIKDTYDNASSEGGWLIISTIGAFGILRPEGRMDDELYIRL